MSDYRYENAIKWTKSYIKKIKMHVDSGKKLSYDNNVNDCKMCKMKMTEQTRNRVQRITGDFPAEKRKR